MLNSDDLIFFTALAAEASLAAAARKMNVTPSAVTQRLKALESKLGLTLTHRNGRSLLLTDEGELLVVRGSAMVRELASLDETLLALRGSVIGPLRIIAPFGFGRRHVAAICASFRRTYDNVTIDLHLSDKIGRYPDRSWDLAIHVGELPLSGLNVRTIAGNQRFVCASPEYLAARGEPATPADLQYHDCLVLRENDEDASLWKFSRGSEVSSVRLSATLSSNDGELIRDWALAGMGVMVRSEWDVSDDIADGRLVRLLSNYILPAADVVMLVDSSSEQRLRTKKFVQHLVDNFSPPPWRRR